jgi:tRNA A-37 threonylcarbamoyl transferase component Bud32
VETPALRRSLKRGRARTVLTEERGGEQVVIKRFHHPNVLQALRDPGRARAEFRALEHLSRRGVRVPRPLELVDARGGAELCMEAVPGAIVLTELLAASRRDAPAPGRDWGRLVVRLGRLLAGLHGSEVEHSDLHAGNVLVDERDRPWLIDFHAARLVRGPASAERLRRDLVTVTAHAREALPARLRARFLLAWRRALAPELAAVLEPTFEAELEDRARRARREHVAHGVNRWLRPSSRCRVERTSAARVYVPLLLAARPLPLPVRELPAREARERWLAAARLVEHGLPAARPARLELAGARAALGLEVDLAGPLLPAGSRERALATVLGLLHDRGLALPGLAAGDLLAVEDAGFVLAPPRELADFDPLEPGGHFDAETAEQRTAYLAAFGDRPLERARVADLIR